jgi:hypothetical protein
MERSLSARECVTRWPTDLGSVASEADIQAPLLRCAIISASRARGTGPRSRKSTSIKWDIHPVPKTFGFM